MAQFGSILMTDLRDFESLSNKKGSNRLWRSGGSCQAVKEHERVGRSPNPSLPLTSRGAAAAGVRAERGQRCFAREWNVCCKPTPGAVA